MAFMVLLLAVMGLHAWLELTEKWKNAERDRVMRRVDRVLRIWAETWGESPETVKQRLVQALQES